MLIEYESLSRLTRVNQGRKEGITSIKADLTLGVEALAVVKRERERTIYFIKSD